MTSQIRSKLECFQLHGLEEIDEQNIESEHKQRPMIGIDSVSDIYKYNYQCSVTAIPTGQGDHNS